MKKLKDFFRNQMNPNISKLSHRTLLLNVYLSQLMIVFIGLVIIFFQKQQLMDLFHFHALDLLFVYGIVFAALVLLVDLIAGRWVPKEITDDGGMNEFLFGNLSLAQIIILCFVVAFCEEILFRGAIQSAWGAYWTSIFFAAIHFRYLKHWIMTGLVFSTSYGLGWIFEQTQTLWTPIVAHFLIDFVLACFIRFHVSKEENHD